MLVELKREEEVFGSTQNTFFVPPWRTSSELPSWTLIEAPGWRVTLYHLPSCFARTSRPTVEQDFEGG